MFFAALTTAIAFLSLLLGDLKPVIEFGKMMAFGITIAFISTFTFLPSLLSVIGNTSTTDRLNLYKITNKILEISKTRTSIIYFLFSISFVALIFGASKLEVENRFIDYFDKNTEIHQGMLEIDKHLGGTSTLDIIIKQPVIIELNNDFSDDLFDDDLFADEGSNASGYWWNVYTWLNLKKYMTI